MRSSKKVFIKGNKLVSGSPVSSPTAVIHDGMVDRSSNVEGLITMRYLLSRKEQELVVFVKEEFLH